MLFICIVYIFLKIIIGFLNTLMTSTLLYLEHYHNYEVSKA